MAKYKIFWTFSDSGKSIVEADSEEEARKKFRQIPQNELYGDDLHNGASILMMYPMKPKEGGGGE